MSKKLPKKGKNLDYFRFFREIGNFTYKKLICEKFIENKRRRKIKSIYSNSLKYLELDQKWCQYLLLSNPFDCCLNIISQNIFNFQHIFFFFFIIILYTVFKRFFT